MKTTTNRCNGSSRSFPIPAGINLAGKRQAPCPHCGKTVHVTRWNSIKQTMILTIHKGAES